jgi:MFS family permease
MRDLRTEFLQKPMNGFQVYVIAVMTLLNAKDGYDILAMSFAGTVLAREWSLTPDMLGWLISAGLVGMVAGSLLVAPLADKLGRRLLLVIALSLDTIGVFASTLSQGAWELAGWRFLTGLGIGAMLASVASATAEFANAARRALCVSIMAIGYPAGAVLGGMVAAALVASTGDWRQVFYISGYCSLVALPLVMLVPDSLEYLLDKRPRDALQRVNRLLPRLGMTPAAGLPPRAAYPDRDSIYQRLAKEHGRSLVLITVAYFMFTATLYFPLTWMPGMLTQAGLSPQMGISGAALMNGGGVIGGVVFGLVAARWGGLRSTVPAWMLLAVLAITLFGLLPVSLLPMMIVGAVIGFGLIGTASGLYATYSVIFPPGVRNTGTGIVIGVGRVGGILSPIVAGYLIATGVPRALYCFLLALPLLLAVFLLRAIPELRPAPTTARDGSVPAPRGSAEA